MATHSSILHGQRSLANYSPQGCTEPDTTEATWLTHMIKKDENFFKLSFLGGCISLDHIRLHAMGLPSCTQQESKRRQSSAAVIARINVQGLKLLPPPCPFSSSQCCRKDATCLSEDGGRPYPVQELADAFS